MTRSGCALLLAATLATPTIQAVDYPKDAERAIDGCVRDLVGLARAAISKGDLVHYRAALRRARLLRPDDEKVARLLSARIPPVPAKQLSSAYTRTYKSLDAALNAVLEKAAVKLVGISQRAAKAGDAQLAGELASRALAVAPWSVEVHRKLAHKWHDDYGWLGPDDFAGVATGKHVFVGGRMTTSKGFGDGEREALADAIAGKLADIKDYRPITSGRIIGFSGSRLRKTEEKLLAQLRVLMRDLTTGVIGLGPGDAGMIRLVILPSRTVYLSVVGDQIEEQYREENTGTYSYRWNSLLTYVGPDAAAREGQLWDDTAQAVTRSVWMECPAWLRVSFSTLLSEPDFKDMRDRRGAFTTTVIHPPEGWTRRGAAQVILGGQVQFKDLVAKAQNIWDNAGQAYSLLHAVGWMLYKSGVAPELWRRLRDGEDAMKVLPELLGCGPKEIEQMALEFIAYLPPVR